jgi:hypothetical protein
MKKNHHKFSIIGFNMVENYIFANPFHQTCPIEHKLINILTINSIFVKLLCNMWKELIPRSGGADIFF